MKLKPLMKKKNKKGSIVDIIVWLAVSFITIIVLAVLIYGYGIITDSLATMDQPLPVSPNNSISNISADIFGQVDTAQTDGFHVIAFAIIFFTGISIPIVYFVQKAHPVFFAVYLLIIIAAFIASVYISNQYEDLLVNEVLGDTLTEFTGSNFIMLNLPIWTSIIGIAGAIFLFSGILKDAGSGGALT